MIRFSINSRGKLVCRAISLVVIVFGTLSLCGCGAKQPWYTITLKNEGQRALEGVVLTSDKFSCEIERLAPGATSDPMECSNSLPETAHLVLVPRDGSPVTSQEIPMKGVVGEKVYSATIEFAVGPDGKLTVKGTPREQ